MRITILTTDGDLLRALAETSKAEEVATGFTIGPLQRIPGALESFWQLGVDIGLVGLPMGIFGNMIASWLMQAAPPRPAAPPRVKLVIRAGGKPIDIEVTLDGVESMKLRIESALADADLQP